MMMWISLQALSWNHILVVLQACQRIWNVKQDGVMGLSCGLRLVLPVGSAKKCQLCCQHPHTLQKHIGRKQFLPSRSQLPWHQES